MRQCLIPLAALFVLIAPPGPVAEPYAVDKSHAFVTFTADHLGFSSVHGQFRDFDAEIDFDPSNVEASKVTFTVRTASVETHNQTRDDQLRSGAFFDSGKFPEMVFTSTEVQPTGSDTARIKGNLTLIGVTHEIELDARLNQIGPSPFFPDITVEHDADEIRPHGVQQHPFSRCQAHRNFCPLGYLDKDHVRFRGDHLQTRFGEDTCNATRFFVVVP